MSTFLMSYPGPDWHIRGGANPQSKSRPRTNPKRAFREWLTLADAIVRAGGHILVMPPVAQPPLTGLPYTSNLGQLFGAQNALVFLVSKMAAPHRQAEAEHAGRFLAAAGLRTATAQHPWEGQADITLVGGNRYIATWGPRSTRQALDDIRPLLPPGARVLDIEIRDPNIVHGDGCLAALTNRGNQTVLLTWTRALGNVTPDALRAYVGDKVDVLPIEDEDDARALATSAVSVGGTLLLPAGLSSGLRGHLIRRGFALEELALPELLGKGGGGPRSLVNELRGVVLNPGSPDYATIREDLFLRLEKYPEEGPAPSPQTPPAAPA